MKFWLGTHEASWLAKVDVPLFVSRRRLARLKKLPVAQVEWALDSGGFTELGKFGGWTITAREYADEVRRYAETVGMCAWAAPQDWMCEPFITAKTGRTVLDHQQATVANYLDLRALDCDVIPVLQGFTIGDYLRCVELYDRAGIDLADEPLVGLGSVCRRQNTAEIGAVVNAIHDTGVTSLHGFGCKSGAIKRYGNLLASADSLAWSRNGRWNGKCLHLKSRCANHLHFALDWRDRCLAAIPGGTHQPALFNGDAA